jgi:Tannase and feruloyl esterase
MMQSIWGTLQETVAGDPVPACKLAAASAAAIAACDMIDGVKDGVIEDPQRCTYDAQALVGTSAGECGDFTQADVDVIRKIWQGPRRQDGRFLWYGQMRGTDLNVLVASRGTPLKIQPFPFTVDWMKYWLTENPQFDWSTLTPALYEHFWDQSGEEYGIVIGTDNPRPECIPRPRRQGDHPARMGRSVHYRRGNYRLFQASPAADGRRGKDVAVCAAVYGAVGRPLRRRRRAKPLRSTRHAAFQGGRRQSAGDFDRRSTRPNWRDHPV